MTDQTRSLQDILDTEDSKVKRLFGDEPTRVYNFFADEFFGDGVGNGDFNFNMNASGNGRGWGRGYDRFTNHYGYAPYYGYAPVPYGYGAPVMPYGMPYGAPPAPARGGSNRR